MCFYSDDYDEVATIWRPTLVKKCRKPRRCASCRRNIEIGESLISVFTVCNDDADTSCFCNQCCQDWVSIHRAELVRGCANHESWCQAWDIARLIREGDDDLEEHRDLPYRERYEFGPVLEWPYLVPPARQSIDLKSLTELLDHLGLAGE